MQVARPLRDRIVVERQEEASKRDSGLFLPDTAKERPDEGVIIAVGPGGYQDGIFVPMALKLGDRIVFAKYSGSAIKLGEKEVLILAERDALAVIEDMESLTAVADVVL